MDIDKDVDIYLITKPGKGIRVQRVKEVIIDLDIKRFIFEDYDLILPTDKLTKSIVDYYNSANNYINRIRYLLKGKYYFMYMCDIQIEWHWRLGSKNKAKFIGKYQDINEIYY